MGKTTCVLTAILLFVHAPVFAQNLLPDSNAKNNITDRAIQEPGQVFNIKKGKALVYTKPEPFGFLKKLPHDAAGIIVTAFKRENIKPLFIVGGATLLLMLADEPVAANVHSFSRHIHFHADESYRDILDLKLGKTNISLLKAPENLNTALYQMGQGFPTMLISAGLFAYGRVHNNYRALSTANQLAETFILMGIGTQLLKRISGRQSPSNATDRGGNWHFLPSFKSFENNTPNFDAFPSGHLATIMSTVTVLAENYPESRLIKPVGYSLMGLIGAAMINNNVHWISDYPMAIALGYLCAKQVAKRSRRISRDTVTYRKTKAQLSYTFNYTNNHFMPGLVYRF